MNNINNDARNTGTKKGNNEISVVPAHNNPTGNVKRYIHGAWPIKMCVSPRSENNLSYIGSLLTNCCKSICRSSV